MMKRTEIKEEMMEQVNGGGLYIVDAYNRAVKKAAFELRIKDQQFTYYENDDFHQLHKDF